MTITAQLLVADRAHEVGTVRRSLDAVLTATRLMSMATVHADGTPWIHQAYFAHDKRLTLYFLTRPSARHSTNLVHSHGVVAAAVADSQQPGTPGTRRGVQLRGRCRPLEQDEYPRGAAVFCERYPAFRERLLPPGGTAPAADLPVRLYRMDVDEFRLIDESIFGTEVWLDARLVAG